MNNIIIKWLVPEPAYYNVFRDRNLKPDIDTQKLKDMQLGASTNAVVQDPVFSPGEGMSLSAVTTGGADPVSETVYVVAPAAKLETPFYLRIEVLFDQPYSTVVPGTWALALNLKRGTATDAGPDADTPVGPNCKFYPANHLNKGVWLTGTINDVSVDDMGTYGQYLADSTVFGLSAELTRAGLKYGGSGRVVLLDKSGLKSAQGDLTEQNFDDPSITNMAIGIALVNQGGTKTVSVRLRSFAIWTKPIGIEIEHILLKHHPQPDPEVIVPLERTKIQRRV